VGSPAPAGRPVASGRKQIESLSLVQRGPLDSLVLQVRPVSRIEARMETTVCTAPRRVFCLNADGWPLAEAPAPAM
jgi:hypothetical protein